MNYTLMGRSATRTIAARWVRRAISQKYVDNLLENIDTEDLPFDHLFEGKRRLVLDPKEYGGLGVDYPENEREIVKFLESRGLLNKEDDIDWKGGYIVNWEGKIKSKVNKAINKALNKDIGSDRKFMSSREQVRRDLNKAESPSSLTIGVGRDNIRALTGMGHLFVEDFPTAKIWKELKNYDNVPSPESWERIKEVADAFSKLTQEEVSAKRDEHEREYQQNYFTEDSAGSEKGQSFEDRHRQYWDARGLFSTLALAYSDDLYQWSMRNLKNWKDRTDDFYRSKDSAAVRTMHDLGSKIDSDRLAELQKLAEVEQLQQDYALWRSAAGIDLSIVVSRDPIDVLRMSDHPKAVQKIESCHSEGGSEFQCAISEAEEGGLVAYVVKTSDIEGKDLDSGELFEDHKRGVDGIKPYARLRLRRFENDEGSGGLEVAVPETTTYGANFPDFVEALTKWSRETQPEFYAGDAGYSKRPRDWRLTGGTYQDNSSSELFDNFFDRDEEDDHYREPTEDEYDPFGEGYTLEDSPYYDPDREDDEDGGESEVSAKRVEPWRYTDRMSDFWQWMQDNHPEIPNPNRRGTKDKISPNTLKGYARGRTNYSAAARELVGRYMARYQEEKRRREEVEPDRSNEKGSSSGVPKRAAKPSFKDWVSGRRFKNPDTGNKVLFKSLPQSEQDRIRSQWGRDRGQDASQLKKVRDPLFHTTSYANLDAIASRGLVPRSGQGGTFQHGGYAEHSQGKVFLSDNPEAARAWQSKVFDQLEDRYGDSEDLGQRLPVMLRIKARPTKLDEVGDQDVSGSRYTNTKVPPKDIEFWHPSKKRWEPVSNWGQDTDVEGAITEQDEYGTHLNDEYFMPGYEDDDYDRDWEPVRKEEERARQREKARVRKTPSAPASSERSEYLEPAVRREWINRIKEHGAKSPFPMGKDWDTPGVFPTMWQERLKVDREGNPLPDYPLAKEGREALLAAKVAHSWLREVSWGVLKRTAGIFKLSEYNKDFLQWVGQQRFVNPDTKNRVLFVSLPEEEQQKIYARWQSMNQGEEAERVQRENKWLTPNQDPLRYDHVKFNILFDEDEDRERLENIFSTDDPDEISDLIMDLSGAGGIASMVREVKTLFWNEGNRIILKVMGNGDHGLRFERNLNYEVTGDEDSPYVPEYIENTLISVGKSAPPGVGTKMLASQVAAASEAGFSSIEAEAARSDKMNGYYTWPRLGFNAELTQGHLDELEDDNPDAAWQVMHLAEMDKDRVWPDAPAELVHVMAVPEARDWWEREGHTVLAMFPVSDFDGGKAYNILREYTAAKAMAEGQTIPEYLSKMSSTKKSMNTPPEFTEQDNRILDQAWENLRQRILQGARPKPESTEKKER